MFSFFAFGVCCFLFGALCSYLYWGGQVEEFKTVLQIGSLVAKAQQREIERLKVGK